ncbi:VOC family protein [Tropicimonas omnivorans]
MRRMKVEGVLEAALYASDLAAADAFYGGTLGMEVIARKEARHIFYRAGSTVLLVFNPDATAVADPGGGLPVPLHGAKGPGHVCFTASGAVLDDWTAHFAKEGIEIEADFLWPNGARSVYVRDPAGNSVEFAEPRLWGMQ